jgi:hypothetical protein
MAGYGQDNTYQRHNSKILRLHPIATLLESKIEYICGAWVDLCADIGDGQSRNPSSQTWSVAVPRHKGACYHGCANREFWLVLGEHYGFLDCVLDAMSIGKYSPSAVSFEGIIE